jgi:hypothetical protein
MHPIPPKHKRGIAARLAMLDQRMCDVERWAHRGQWASVLYEEHNPLSPHQGRRILAEIAAIRAILVGMKDDLELDVRVGLAARSIQAWCTTTCQQLEELEEKHLRRYGEAPPGLADYLKPRLEELTERLQRISAVAGEAIHPGPG